MVFYDGIYWDAFFELRNGREYDATKARKLKEWSGTHGWLGGEVD